MNAFEAAQATASLPFGFDFQHSSVVIIVLKAALVTDRQTDGRRARSISIIIRCCERVIEYV